MPYSFIIAFPGKWSIIQFLIFSLSFYANFCL
jgi:hypothetical protein